MVDILTAVLSDGLAAVEAACGEALREGVHSAAVILNILARRREPTAPITIITPDDALRLRQEPTADCARDDSPRRAVQWSEHARYTEEAPLAQAFPRSPVTAPRDP
jgi:hypothetical protein